MGKYIIETIGDDNKSKYLANVYLLKVAGMEKTGNEWVFDDEKAANSVARVINQTYGSGIWTLVKVVEEEMTPIEKARAAKAAKAKARKEEDEKVVTETKNEEPHTIEETEETNIAEDEETEILKEQIKEVDDAIDWYSDISTSDDDEYVAPVKTERVSKSGKPLAQSVTSKRANAARHRTIVR